MKLSFGLVLCLLVLKTATPTNGQNVALFWNLYDAVVRGGRIIHDVSLGVGAVSKAIQAIDSFLDISAEEEINAALEDQQEVVPGDTPVNKSPPPSGDITGSNKLQGGNIDKPDQSNLEVSTPSGEVPKFNGCGALGFHIRDDNIPVNRLTDCCGSHELCYSSSCKVKKRDCDYKLRRCLFYVCEGLVIDKSHVKSCKAASKLLFSGTMALSFQQYSDAQARIGCSSTHKDKGQRKQKDRKRR